MCLVSLCTGVAFSYISNTEDLGSSHSSTPAENLGYVLEFLSYPIAFSTQFRVTETSYCSRISLFGYLVQMLVKASSTSYA